jgi:hypothetical protein
MKKGEKHVPEFDPVLVRDISEAVYKDRVDDGGHKKYKDHLAMIAKDGDNGEKLRERAGSYDPLTVTYLRALKAKGLLL